MLHVTTLRHLPRTHFKNTRPFMLRTIIRNNVPAPTAVPPQYLEQGKKVSPREATTSLLEESELLYALSSEQSMATTSEPAQWYDRLDAPFTKPDRYFGLGARNIHTAATLRQEPDYTNGGRGIVTDKVNPESPRAQSIKGRLDEMDSRDLEFPTAERRAMKRPGDLLKDPASVMLSQGTMSMQDRAGKSHSTFEQVAEFGGTSKVNTPFTAEESDLSKMGTANYQPGPCKEHMGIDGGFTAATETLHQTGDSMVSNLMNEGLPRNCNQRDSVFVEIEEMPLPAPRSTSGAIHGSQPLGSRRAFHSSATLPMRIYSVSEWHHPSMDGQMPLPRPARRITLQPVEQQMSPSRDKSTNAFATAMQALDDIGRKVTDWHPIRDLKEKIGNQMTESARMDPDATITEKVSSMANTRQADLVELHPLGRFNRMKFNMEKESKENPMLEDLMGGNGAPNTAYQDSPEQKRAVTAMEAMNADDTRDMKHASAKHTGDSHLKTKDADNLAVPRLQHIEGEFPKNTQEYTRKFSSGSSLLGRRSPWPSGYLKSASTWGVLEDLFENQRRGVTTRDVVQTISSVPVDTHRKGSVHEASSKEVERDVLHNRSPFKRMA